MATIKTAVQIYDGMSPSLKSISNSMKVVIKSFNNLQDISSKAVDNGSIKLANDELIKSKNIFNGVGKEIKNAEDKGRNFNNSIKDSCDSADNLYRKLKNVSGVLISIAGLKKGISIVKDWLEYSDYQTRAEEQLKTVMGKRMGTKDIGEFLDITSDQQKIGVLGDEIQLMGAQQLATFLTDEKALKKLIPAMNNLAVQQKGVNTTGEDMVHIGNMMGKVIQGQTAALARNGVTFSKAQEQVLKYGTEIEKAATLAQVITDNVGEMNKTLANTPQGKIAQIKNSWGDIKETVGLSLYNSVLRFFSVISDNMPLIQNLMQGFVNVSIVLIEVFRVVLDISIKIYKVFKDNWSLISPVIFGVVGALVAFKTIGVFSSIITSLLSLNFNYFTQAVLKATGAQNIFNKALMACPLVRIVMITISLVAVFYLVIAVINKFAHTSISATGVIAGSFAFLGAYIYNSFVVFVWNSFSNLANFFCNVFKHPVVSVKMLFLNMAETVIGYIKSMVVTIGKLLNKIPGVQIDITNGVDNIYGKIKSEIENTKSKSNWQEKVKKLDYIAYDKAYNVGYDFGSNIKDKLSMKKMFDNLKDPSAIQKNMQIGSVDGGILQDTLDKISGGVNDTVHNTGSIKDGINQTEEDLKYLRDIAAREVINKFTTAEIKVDLGGVVNNVSKETDLDGIVTYLEKKLYETMTIAAEGVHL